jgi:hypothetical protein
MDAVTEYGIEVRLGRIEHLVEKVLHLLERKNFTINLKLLENTMSIGNIVAGTTAQIGAELLENGVLYTPPAGSTYVFTPTIALSGAAATLAPATVDASNGEIPLADQFVLSVAAGDPTGTVTLTPSATGPNGYIITGPALVIPVTAEAQVFTISLSQLA